MREIDNQQIGVKCLLEYFQRRCIAMQFSPGEPTLSHVPSEAEGLSKGATDRSPGRKSWDNKEKESKPRRACPELVEGGG